ncbi:MAG: general stress protein [Sporichthyaceae bacterium]
MSNDHRTLIPRPAAAAEAREVTAPKRLLAEFPTYRGAEELVDRLSDKEFPVEHCRIVGNGLRSVEDVTGRLTGSRAALAGAASGAWFGLFVGLLLGMFSTGSAWIAVLFGSTVLGAVWMGAFGFLAHWATRGRRDFASTKNLEADSYAVYVDAARADEALRLAGLL